MSYANLYFINKALIQEYWTYIYTEDGYSLFSYLFFKNIINYSTLATNNTILLQYIIIKDYIRRKLTYNSDKLAAVAGLTRYVSSRVASVSGYLFSLQKSNLLRGLLQGQRARSLKDISYSATTSYTPSWSQALRKSKISYNRGIVSLPPLKLEFDL